MAEIAREKLLQGILKQSLKMEVRYERHHRR